jgi:hypothetical protein
MNGIDGVAYSFVNESGTRIRLSLRPGADRKRVTEAVRRVLSEQTKDLVPVQLAKKETGAALQREGWLDNSRLGELTAMETGGNARRTPVLPIALFLGWMAVGLCLLRWQRRRRQQLKAGHAAATQRFASRCLSFLLPKVGLTRSARPNRCLL